MQLKSQFSNSNGTIVLRYDWCWEITRFGVERAYCSSFFTTRCHCGFSHRAIFSETLSQQTEQDVDKCSLFKQFDENWKGNSCFDLLRLRFCESTVNSTHFHSTKSFVLMTWLAWMLSCEIFLHCYAYRLHVSSYFEIFDRRGNNFFFLSN